jgi:undecaprenyl-diphosphatase
MNIGQIVVLAVIQGLAELLPVSSSAHVILAQKLMGLDPSAPQMTFLLVMLHTGTMCAVLFYFWKRWAGYFSSETRKRSFVIALIMATSVTGIVGINLKLLLEKLILPFFTGHSENEIEHMFKSLPLIGFSLFAVGSLIVYAGFRESRAKNSEISLRDSIWVGLIQGLCLPFRGFSRSGATISVSMLRGISRPLAEDFSFALAVLVTPPVIILQLRRLLKAHAFSWDLFTPGLLGMGFSFLAGLLALKWLSAWLEHGRWKLFGFYCFFAAIVMWSIAFRA